MAIFQAETLDGIPYTLSGLPDGPEGVRKTLAAMSDFVRQSNVNPDFVNFARSLISNVRQKDFSGEANSIHNWVRDNIRYTQDPYSVEFVQLPDITIQTRQGDCDDKSTLVAALLQAIGHPARFVAVGFTPEGFDHVYVETKIKDKWLGSDTTEEVPLGWSPPNPKLRMVWKIK